jgi:hypothetical protein
VRWGKNPEFRRQEHPCATLLFGHSVSPSLIVLVLVIDSRDVSKKHPSLPRRFGRTVRN